MKNLLITSSVEVMGRHCPEGTIVRDVPNDIAAEIIHAGRAEAIPDLPPAEIVHADPVVEHRDTAAPKRKKSPVRDTPES